MSAPTPGPWEMDAVNKAVKKGTRPFWQIVARDGATVVAEVDGSHDDGRELRRLPPDENEANACLSAAAPAFAFVWALVPDDIKQGIFDVLHTPADEWIEQAIAKAEGRQ